jgi:hypothetical protein
MLGLTRVEGAVDRAFSPRFAATLRILQGSRDRIPQFFYFQSFARGSRRVPASPFPPAAVRPDGSTDRASGDADRLLRSVFDGLTGSLKKF